VHLLLDRGVQGMIFISCEMTNLRGDHSHYAKLVDEGARIVFVNGAVNSLDVPSVGVDERAAGEIATQHLISLGHERIGFVAGPEHYLPTQLKDLSIVGFDGIDAARWSVPELTTVEQPIAQIADTAVFTL
jgi:DNA-binding LacI/PurR family transcriptional regulator